MYDADAPLGRELAANAIDAREKHEDALHLLLGERIDEAIQNSSGGADRIAELYAIMTDRELDDEQKLSLRAGLRESTIDGQSLARALERRSPAAVADVIDRSRTRVGEIYETRREAWDVATRRALIEQQRVVEFVNDAEVSLPARDRARIESALGDGRANPKTIETMLANNQTSEVVELALELDEEHEIKRTHARSLRRS